MKRIILSLWGIASALFCMAQTPQDYIKGQVVDQNNNPLFGANLVWEGTTIGVISDAEGFFHETYIEGPVLGSTDDEFFSSHGSISRRDASFRILLFWNDHHLSTVPGR